MMRITFFTHSLVSDWNHGNAHFLRGVMRALQSLGHTCLAMEPEEGWSRLNLIQDCGEGAVARFHTAFPDLTSRTYSGVDDIDEALDSSDVVIVHEWTEPEIVAAIGKRRAQGGRFRLLFHDTHHRAQSAGDEIGSLALDAYDGVLCFGKSLRDLYRRQGWASRAYTWHEAADVTVFHPREPAPDRRDLVWVGNWGDGERSDELMEFLVRPAAELNLATTIRGVRYPPDALRALKRVGIDYAGSIANVDVPQAFADHRVTVHVPRRPYTQALPGIPTIRVFEALACGIPLVCAPWDDCEGLFEEGKDYLMARDGLEMKRALRDVLTQPSLADELSRNGLATIAARHTCDHRARELISILEDIGQPAEEMAK